MFLGMAMNCFEDSHKQEEAAQEQAIADNLKEAQENKISLKISSKQQEEMKAELNAMKKMHARVKEVNNFVLKKHLQTMGPATIDHMHVTSVFINEMINKVKSTKDFAKIITMVEMFNNGDFDEAFKAMEQKPSIDLLTKTNEDIVKDAGLDAYTESLNKEVENTADNSKGD